MPRHRLIGGVKVNVNVVAWVVGVIALDSASKWWARHQVRDSGRHVLGPLWLRVTYNRGVSFSFSPAGPVFTSLAILIIVGVIAYVGLRAAPGLPTVGLGLLLGGGVANEIDRLLSTSHGVTDFISVGWFPVFNLADAAITVGFVVLLVSMLRGARLVQR